MTDVEMDQSALFIPEQTIGGTNVTLVRPVSAIQLVKKEDGSVKLGLLAQLGPGTNVVLCGKGFNERTVKVRAQDDRYFFVFREDVPCPEAWN
jgi:hypothetical protein